MNETFANWTLPGAKDNMRAYRIVGEAKQGFAASCEVQRTVLLSLVCWFQLRMCIMELTMAQGHAMTHRIRQLRKAM